MGKAHVVEVFRQPGSTFVEKPNRFGHRRFGRLYTVGSHARGAGHSEVAQDHSMVCTESVSYTHLDVYKRQPMKRLMLKTVFLGLVIC